MKCNLVGYHARRKIMHPRPSFDSVGLRIVTGLIHLCVVRRDAYWPVPN